MHTRLSKGPKNKDILSIVIHCMSEIVFQILMVGSMLFNYPIVASIRRLIFWIAIVGLFFGFFPLFFVIWIGVWGWSLVLMLMGK
ncbi:hypothetical protein [Companilactobacillus heilongjiangensis]|uniref:Uncharacterized protein n=1 Tax=Companilactobacillus heilongjiangensis TaxID=1074467 RepID=A0A0K2LC97_9LACO|nr:hypothetical protein [Companilactobacillus heilongjiangensis]ALB28890.1 hypothetical protein JP39_05675 [Companilactobacillus heilongjiangensis]